MAQPTRCGRHWKRKPGGICNEIRWNALWNVGAVCRFLSKAADRNPYSWNMEFYEYPDGSGYEGRFTKCGICVLMKKLGLYDLTPALCRLDYTMSEAGGVTDFVRQYTLASGGPYCDCEYKKKL